jgi:hypothetical protein
VKSSPAAQGKSIRKPILSILKFGLIFISRGPSVSECAAPRAPLKVQAQCQINAENVIDLEAFIPVRGTSRRMFD